MLKASSQTPKPTDPARSLKVTCHGRTRHQRRRPAEGADMYLCLCNAISDAKVEIAVQEGARRPRDVYARCGCRAQCGRCTAAIVGALRGLAAAAPAPHASQTR